MQINNQHLLSAYGDFKVRFQEVEAYVKFVQHLANLSEPTLIEKYPWELALQDVTSRLPPYPEAEYKIDRDLQKTLRASTYLLMYNLLESTMSEAINSVHETIKEEALDILDLSIEIHKIILTSFQKGLTEAKIGEYARQNKDIRDNLLDLGYDKKRLFSGNIDYEVIDKYCNRYGFKPHVYHQNNEPLKWDKSILEGIRKKRNSLAHGAESFAHCGQNMVVDTIDDNLKNVYAVLMGVFNGLNHFLDHKKYLRSP